MQAGYVVSVLSFFIFLAAFFDVGKTRKRRVFVDSLLTFAISGKKITR